MAVLGSTIRDPPAMEASVGTPLVNE